MLFLIWLASAFVIVGIINIYLRYFGLPRNNVNNSFSSSSFTAGSSSGVGCVDGGGGWLRRKSSDAGGEPVSWLTSSVAWLHHKCSQTPEFVDAWLRALTQEVERQQLQQMTGILPPSSSQIQIRFDGVHGPPPEFHTIKADTTSAEQLTLAASVTGKEIVLQLCCFLTNPIPASEAATPGPASEVVNCDARIQWIKGKIKLVVKLINNELSLSISFLQPPDVRILVKPIRANSHIDTATVESLVRSAISSATTTISWTSSRAQMGVPPQRSPSLTRHLLSDQLQSQPLVTTNTQMRQQSFYRRDPLPSSALNPLTNQNLSGEQSPPIASSASLSYNTTQPLTSQNQQHNLLQENGLQRLTNSNQKGLLVKVIKANGLVDTDWGSCNSYCLVKLNHPVQSFMTNVVRNTVNPLWEEEFIFDLDAQSKTLQFEVLDRDKAPDNDLLGKASVLLDEIRRMPSNRQILPLTGRPRSRTATSGSVTVELIFHDPLNPLNPLSTQQSVSSLAHPSSPTTSSPQQLLTSGVTIGSHDNGLLGSYPTGSLKEGTLSAHDMALTGNHPGSPKSLDNNPTLVVTGAPILHTQTLQANQGYRSSGELKGRAGDKKEGFAATLKKKFALKKGSRAQSVDRYQSASLRETAYFKPPPTHPYSQQPTASHDDTHVQYGDKRERSNSFGSSIKSFFNIKKDKKLTSRDNSLNRPTGHDGASSGGLTHYPGGGNYYREGTPVPPGRQDNLAVTSTSYNASTPLNKPVREY